MGISGISPWSLLLIVVILLLLFGTKRLKSMGKDLGSMIHSFQKSFEDEKNKPHKRTPKKKIKK